MKIIKLLSAIIAVQFIQACTPAQLVDIPDDPTIDNGKVLVYRESAYNAAGIPMIFGQGEADHKELWNSDFVELEYDEGHKVFFVRSNQADVPHKLPVRVRTDKQTCLKGYANPDNYIKALFIPAWYFSNTFFLAEVPCPSDSEIAIMDRIH